ncbi:putative surface protease GP63 [Trypanosoma grayi]|uniref:putative surface protease GP63 n=1 Tax=Trypanosoma grayi TaxID=71804 RepID=UPI0004F3FCF4|nr:putative surface protease GP63 [Trypanosoma grayi]KEG06672.1 putative surface protease GP63 [Trypanosoma grayi]
MWSLVIVALTVALLLCSDESLALLEHLCIFDKLRRHGDVLPIAVVRETARKGEGLWHLFTAAVPGWAPIRIKVFTEDMKSPDKYCTKEGEMRPDFRGENVLCQKGDILTPERNATIINELIPAAVKLHADRLLVRPVMGDLVVPEFSGGLCMHFAIPSSHHKAGVSDADMILYAAAGPTNGMTLAWAMTCSWLRSGRPASGVMNFGPKSITATSLSIRTTAHEIAHALGFNYEQMVILKMISTVRGVRGKNSVMVVSSPKTKEMAQKHYNCSTVEGMELEDEGGQGTARSHWERRNAKNELMAGMSGAGYYTALTMGAFEDMMFYKANWGMEEHMRWGHNSGCKLLEEKCLVNGVSAYPDMFCNKSTGGAMHCTFDRQALGYCSLASHEKPLPEEYQYFESPSVGGQAEALEDYCPTIFPHANYWCADSSGLTVPGSRMGPTSRCLKGDALHLDANAIGDVCGEVSCNDGTVSVRYLGDDTWYPCPEGGHITPNVTFLSGRILCPNYADVCITHPNGSSGICPTNSSGKCTRLSSSRARAIFETFIDSEVFDKMLVVLAFIWLFLLILLICEAASPLLPSSSWYTSHIAGVVQILAALRRRRLSCKGNATSGSNPCLA